VIELELPELREMSKEGGVGRGPVEGGRDGTSNAARRSVLASSILDISAIDSRILSQVPWTPWGYSSPFVSTHRNHNRAIRLHTFTWATPVRMITFVVAQIHSFLTEWMVMP